MLAQFAAAAVAAAVFGEFEVFQQGFHGGSIDFRRLHQIAARIRDAVDAPVDVVAERIAGVVLHVPDEDVVPVDDIQRAVGREFEVAGAEIAVGGFQEIVAECRFVSGAVVRDGMLLYAEEADGVSDQYIALDLVGEMAGGNEFKAGRGTDGLTFRDEIRGSRSFHAVGRLEGNRQRPVPRRARGVDEEILAPLIEGEAPWIGDVHLDGALQLGFLRAETVEASVHPAHRAVGSFHVGVEENPLAQHERAGGIGGIGADRVVSVVGVEAGEHHFFGVGLVVAILVREEDKVRLLGNIDAAGRELKADRQVQLIGENGFLVRLPVAVGVLIDEDLVIRLRIAGTVVRVGGHHGNPEPALVVKGKLHRIGKVGEFLFGGEEFRLVSLGCGQRFLGVLTILVFGCAVLVARLIVRLHFGKRMGLRIRCGHIELRSAHDRPDLLIADIGHFTDLLLLVRIVCRAERVVAAPVDVHAVEHSVIVEPIPVLVGDRLHHSLCGSLRLHCTLAENPLFQHSREDLVTFIVGQETVACERLFQGWIELEGWIEDIDEIGAVRLRHLGHRLGVKGEVRVFRPAIGKIALRGKVFIGDRGNQHEARCRLAVVLLGGGMLDEGIKLALEISDPGRAVEGLVVAEECDQRIRLEIREPLVRSRVRALPLVDLVLRMELFGSGKSPLGFPRGMRAEARGVSGAAGVPHGELCTRICHLETRLKVGMIVHPLPEPVADQDDPFPTHRGFRGGCCQRNGKNGEEGEKMS